MDENRMLQRLTVNHETTYRYRRPVMPGEHFLMFRPRDSHDSRLLNATLTIEPQAKLRWLHDVFGNSVTIASFDQPTDQLYFKSQIVIDRYPFPAVEFPIEPFARTIPFSYPLAEIPDLGRTIERHYSDPDRLVTEWTRRWLLAPDGSHETEPFLRALNSSIRDELRYEERSSPGVQSPVETLQRGAGTCRDFALLMMEAVRTVGLAARFVSGYLYDPAIDGAQSDISGAGSTHAWVQVYLPGAGWVEFDPTNASYGGQNLIPVAVAREPIQAMPVSGTYDGAPEDFIEMNVNVEVRAVHIMDQTG
jgi:transglutaminase-like putative cysteine protease